MKRFRGTIIVVLLAGMLSLIAFVVWAGNAQPAEPIPLKAALEDTSVVIGREGEFLTIRPAANARSIGLLFYPGARVAPEAYLSKLAAISAEAHIQIVIGRPRLNLAFFSIQQADQMRSSLSGITRWYAGGHSLGGAMACLYAKDHAESLEGIVLFGTYCGSDVSKTLLRALIIGGQNDGLFPREKLLAARGELPAGAQMIEVSGMNHAQFGNYGRQAGDHEASITDGVARDALRREVAKFFTE